MKHSPRIVRLRITDLIPHPLNPNRMPEAYQAKLKTHIAATGNYPPLIVRLHPDQPKKYQIVDGQNRWAALKALQTKMAICQLWDVDDTETQILLATLNRLEGKDDVYLRGTLLTQLSQQFEISQLAEQLPLDAAAIKKFIEATENPPTPTSAQDPEGMIHAITFFITKAERTQLVADLLTFTKDRGTALLMAVKIALASQP